MRRSLSMFGTYKVDEAKKTVTFEIVSSTYPNAQGQSQLRTIDKLTDDEFVNSNPDVAGGARLGVQSVQAGEVAGNARASVSCWAARADPSPSSGG